MDNRSLSLQYADVLSKQEQELKDVDWWEYDDSDGKVYANIHNSRKEEVIAYFKSSLLLAKEQESSEKDHFRLALSKENLLTQLNHEEKNSGLLMITKFLDACFMAGIYRADAKILDLYRDSKILSFYSHCEVEKRHAFYVPVNADIQQEKFGYPALSLHALTNEDEKKGFEKELTKFFEKKGSNMSRGWGCHSFSKFSQIYGIGSLEKIREASKEFLLSYSERQKAVKELLSSVIPLGAAGITASYIGSYDVKFLKSAVPLREAAEYVPDLIMTLGQIVSLLNSNTLGDTDAPSRKAGLP